MFPLYPVKTYTGIRAPSALIYPFSTIALRIAFPASNDWPIISTKQMFIEWMNILNFNGSRNLISLGWFINRNINSNLYVLPHLLLQEIYRFVLLFFFFFLFSSKSKYMTSDDFLILKLFYKVEKARKGKQMSPRILSLLFILYF